MQLDLDQAEYGIRGLNLLDLSNWREDSFNPGFSGWHSSPQETPGGAAFFTEPNISVLAVPNFQLLMTHPFFSQFDDFAGPADQLFQAYAEDPPIDASAGLVKFAGQMCYLSLGPKRTWNADADAYFENIRKQAHGSILEHANISLAFWGIPRSLTHELVRHRAGFAYSQVSQRYVDGTRLRFVMRPEFIGHPELEQHFVSWVDDVVVEYDKRAELLLKVMGPTLAKLTPTERRKAVNQAARSCLPNETEAPIVVTGNVRAWRHYLNMRGSQAAEPEIRALAVRVLVCLYQISPMLFQDFSIQKDDTGRIFLHTAYPKV